MDTQNLVNLSEKPKPHITMMIFHCLEVLEPRGANFGSFQLCRVGTVECEHSNVSEPCLRRQDRHLFQGAAPTKIGTFQEGWLSIKKKTISTLLVKCFPARQYRTVMQ